MGKKKVNVSVVCQEANGKCRISAEKLATAAKASDCDVSLHDAASFDTAALLAADRFVIGSEDSSFEAFKELKRVCKGINLAGRVIALYGSKDAIDWFKTVFADTDARIACEFGGLPESGKDAASVIKKLLA